MKLSIPVFVTSLWVNVVKLQEIEHKTQFSIFSHMIPWKLSFQGKEVQYARENGWLGRNHGKVYPAQNICSIMLLGEKAAV